jgi:hypothetical protein
VFLDEINKGGDVAGLLFEALEGFGFFFDAVGFLDDFLGGLWVVPEGWGVELFFELG